MYAIRSYYVHYRGTQLNGLRPHEVANLGVVRTFQKTSVFGGISVMENVLIGLHGQGRRQPWEILLGLARVATEEAMLRERASEILAFVGLSARAAELGVITSYSIHYTKLYDVG